MLVLARLSKEKIQITVETDPINTPKLKSVTAIPDANACGISSAIMRREILYPNAAVPKDKIIETIEQLKRTIYCFFDMVFRNYKPDVNR